MFSLGRVSVGQSSSERVEDVNGFGVADCNERMRDVSRNDIGVVRADFVTLAVFDYDKAAFDAIAELFAFVRVHCDFAALAEILKDDFIYVGVNAHWESNEIWLPALPQNIFWKIAVNTDLNDNSFYDEPIPLDT